MTRDTAAARRPRRATRHVLAALGLALAAWGTPRPAHPSTVRVLDAFEDISLWKAVASDGVQAAVHPTEGVRGRGLRLDFDLAGTAGYALARRALPLDVPPHYEITFYLRADAPTNNFQVKLVDASGENVWPRRRLRRQRSIARLTVTRDSQGPASAEPSQRAAV